MKDHEEVYCHPEEHVHGLFRTFSRFYERRQARRPLTFSSSTYFFHNLVLVTYILTSDLFDIFCEMSTKESIKQSANSFLILNIPIVWYYKAIYYKMNYKESLLEDFKQKLPFYSSLERNAIEISRFLRKSFSSEIEIRFVLIIFIFPLYSSLTNHVCNYRSHIIVDTTWCALYRDIT